MARDVSRYVLVGLGGIGSLVARQLVPFLSHAEPGATVALVDGDAFSEANRARMDFGRLGPKAVVLAEELAARYGSRVNLLPVPRYLKARNAAQLIAEGDLVFCQPDNNRTRLTAERRCRRLRDVGLFSGGNDDVSDASGGTFGNVQVYLREGGIDRTNPPSAVHPEIARPADQEPDAAGCAAQAPSAPQLLFTNAAVAAAMLGSFYAWRTGRLDFEEVYLDISSGRWNPVQRCVAGQSAQRRG